MFNKQKDIVTIEIGDRYFKSVYFKVSKNKPTIVGSKMRFAENLTDDDIVKGIHDFIAENRIKKAEVINVIPSKYAIYRNIEIPSVDQNEIRQIIDLQAGAHTPYPKNEIIIDYAETGVMHNRYTKILLVILKRDIVTKRYDLIKRAGHKADNAVLAPELISKFFFELCPDKTDKPIGVVHSDVTSMDFMVVQNDKSIYIRSIPMGTSDLRANPEDGKRMFMEEMK